MANKVQGCIKAKTEDIPRLLEKAGGTVYCQPKLNGVRAWWNVAKMLLMSRTGKLDFMVQASHLVFDVRRIWEVTKAAPDGELYKHGVPLQVISGACRRREPCLWLEYWIFDCVEAAEQKYRAAWLSLAEEVTRNSIYIRIVPTIRASDPRTIIGLYEQWLNEGYEGIVLRFPEAFYTCGKKANVAYKIKPVHTMELRLVGFKEASTDMHKDTFGSLVLQHPTELWQVSCSGLKEDERRFIWLHKESLLGKQVEIAYDELSEEGKPQRLRFVRFRESIDL